MEKIQFPRFSFRYLAIQTTKMRSLSGRSRHSTRSTGGTKTAWTTSWTVNNQKALSFPELYHDIAPFLSRHPDGPRPGSVPLHGAGGGLLRVQEPVLCRAHEDVPGELHVKSKLQPAWCQKNHHPKHAVPTCTHPPFSTPGIKSRI